LDTDLQTLPRPAIERIGVFSSTALWRITPLLLLWLMACWGLADYWRLNPQYQYGWLVPGLAAYALYERWLTRPAPGAPIRQGLWLAYVSGFFLLPAWVFFLPNSSWPLVNWIFVAQIAAITLGIIAAKGGWQWVRHFSFPIMFVFTAVPWPDFVESPVMQVMRQTATSVAVVALDLLGVTALQHGNVLEVVGGAVGVEEACSGIRSLQGSLAASLIAGEIFRFNVPRRIMLIALSIITAFATNLVRIGFLAWNAANSGTAAVDEWHDTAGMTGLLVCVVVIWVVAFRLDAKGVRVPPTSFIPNPHPLPRWLASAAILWIIITISFAEIWYHDPSPAPKGQWTAKPPASSKPVSISPNVWAQLHYDSSIGATWTESGRTWTLFFFDWEFGPTFSRISAQNHRPNICLPATGLELQQDRGKILFEVDGIPLAFHAYSFSQGNELMFVYHGVWPFRTERASQRGPLAEGKHAASLKAVISRERCIGQQSAELFVSGCANAEQADRAFAQLIPQLLRRNSE
jgi:exosortase